MQFLDNTIHFEPCDSHFINEFGQVTALKMVLDFRAFNDLPFIYDAYQLASFADCNRKELFDFVKNCNSFYRKTVIKKKNGADRILNAPSRKLKYIQYRILNHILNNLPVSKFSTAYKKGSSLIKNAGPHVGKKYLLKLDITDFFGSICFEQVYNSVFNTRYFPVQIGTMLTTLCCHNDVLPQGAPTSPAISNIVMRNFDNNIGYWCNKHNISYTRYCDDMTFSSDKPLYHVFEKVKKMLEDMGMEINEKKTRFVTNASRQTVTGLTVNEKVSVSREYKRELRQDVYYALKFGFENDKGMDAKQYKHHLIGKVRYVLQIEPDNNWFSQALWKLKNK